VEDDVGFEDVDPGADSREAKMDGVESRRWRHGRIPWTSKEWSAKHASKHTRRCGGKGEADLPRMPPLAGLVPTELPLRGIRVEVSLVLLDHQFHGYLVPHIGGMMRVHDGVGQSISHFDTLLELPQYQNPRIRHHPVIVKNTGGVMSREVCRIVGCILRSRSCSLLIR